MLGQRIAAQRKALGISQKELAKRLCICPSAVGMYEQGRREPSNNILIALSKELKVSTDFLLTGQNWPAQISPIKAPLIPTDHQNDPILDNPSVHPLSNEALESILFSLLSKS